MRLSHVSLVVAVAALTGAAVAFAAHPKVDPATVPTGFLTAHTELNHVPAGRVRKAIKRGRVDMFVEHARLGAGQATPFVTHPGPVFVMVAAGALTNEEVAGGACRPRTYVKDRGFVTRGIGRPHRITAGPDGADYYLVYLAPRLTGPTQREVAPPDAC